ncbi:DNA-binding MarR family transcriptional regulator [Ereboglobus sp. PH5-10]|uniref:MarR family transcriptional regulator n=1 Tax=Ereboglobus sp. PH5-10 TaxID=2940629 RepID=UPI002406B306|nr:helix-turn-helix domain-containing protein [Ereboglobus sp. PH5-10]MDF9827931.1 DNA-binding MarR family transcriptional regulator [Ereboglobus sp. PH5-10]
MSTSYSTPTTPTQTAQDFTVGGPDFIGPVDIPFELLGFEDTYMFLDDVEELTGVNHWAVRQAHKDGRLAATRIAERHHRSMIINIVDYLEYLFDAEPAGKDKCLEKADVLLANIRIDKTIQPRAQLNQATLDALASKVRRGHPLKRVLLLRIPEEENLLLLDGEHRVVTAKDCLRTTIPAFIVTLPLRYAPYIAFEINQRQGNRIKGSDKKRFVVNFLQTHPDITVQINKETPRKGDTCRADIARALNVSKSTVTRALEDMERHSRAASYDARESLLALIPLIEKLKNSDVEAEQVNLTTYAVKRVASRIASEWEPGVAKDTRARLKLSAHPITRYLKTKLAYFFTTPNDPKNEDYSDASCK